MNFETMYTELSDRIGVYDSSVASDLTKLKRWINMGQQYICGKRLWPFMLKEEIVQTVIDITTGTVDIPASGTTVTFSSAPAVSVQGRYIQVSTSNDWYEITSHTAAASTATISPAYVGTSNLTGGTYTIRKLLYSTSTPLMQILDIKQLITPVRLISQSPRGTDFFLSLYYDAGNPYYYTMSSPNSSGSIQFSLLLSPDSVMNLMVRGVRTLTDLSASTDTSIIPSPWHDAVINIAAFYAFQSVDDTRAADELKVGEMRIQDMSNTLSLDAGRHRVMASVDNDSNFGLQWALPSDYGPWVP